MKNYLIAAIVLVLLFVAAPYGVGVLAEQRVNSGLDGLTEAAPYLTISERKFTRGWFTSEQEVTFEVLGPWARMMNPNAVMEDIAKEQAKQAAQAQAQAQPQDSPAATPPDESAAAGSPDAVASEPQPEAPPAEHIDPFKFTLKNHVVHGPVLWLSGFGIARVDSHLVLPEAVRAEITKAFGDKPIVAVSTRVHFFGGATTTFSGDAQEFKTDVDKSTLSWDAYKFKVAYSAHLDDGDFDGSWPRLEVSSVAKGEKLSMRGLGATGSFHRVRGDVYEGDFKFSVDETRIAGADGETTEIADLHYIGGTTIDDDFMDIALKMGAGVVKSKALEQLGLKLDEVHYDFTLRRLHLDTLVKMSAAVKAAYGKPVNTVGDANEAIYGPMKEYALELFKHDPELVIDRIGVSTADGDAYLKGIVKLKGVNEQDLAAGSMAMIGKIDADITFEMAQSLSKKIPNGEASVATALNQGYVKLEGKNVVSHLEFKAGSLKINGKEQGLPGLGGAPPAAAPQE